MICFVALFVLAIMGLFSATHRRYAKEAFDCVFRRFTLRPCNSSFDEKVKMKISTGLLKRSPALGRFVFKHFEIIGWIFTIIFIASMLYSAYSIYNLVTLGTCDPQNPEQCLFSQGYKDGNVQCTENPTEISDLNPNNVLNIYGKR